MMDRFTWSKGDVQVLERNRKGMTHIHAKYDPDQPRDDDGRWTDGGATDSSTVDHPSFDTIIESSAYKSGKDLGAAPAPDKQASTWTPDAGGTIFHGTTRAFNVWDTGVGYMTDDFKEAEGYAHGVHMGGGRGKWPMVMRWIAAPGKTFDVDRYVADAITNDYDPDDALKAAYKYARSKDARYVVYTHPSNVYQDKEQRVVVSLYPNEDMKFDKLWRRDKKGHGHIYSKTPSSTIERIAQRLEPQLRKRFLAAVEAAKGQVDIEALARAIQAGNFTKAELAAKLQGFPERFGDLAIDLRAGFMAGIAVANEAIAGSSTIMRLDLINPYAVSYAERKLPKIVQTYMENARENIRSIVTEAVSGKYTPQTAATAIRDSIGLTPQYERAVSNLRLDLIEQGFSGEALETKVDRYANKLLTSRAKTIARTEIVQAEISGQRALWNEAANSGVFSKLTAKRVWQTNHEGHTNRGNPTPCPVCEPMDGQEIPFGELYDHPELGSVNIFGEPLVGPPIHPNCLCHEDLIL
jgi:hypothetical protein